LALAATRTHADFPDDPPNDPDWARAEEAFPEGDFWDQSWKHYSQKTLYAPHLPHPGARTDLAWKRTTGRWDVPIAIVDSGAYWDRPDVVEKLWLNPGELPVPEVGAARTVAGVGRSREIARPLPADRPPSTAELAERLEEMGIELEGVAAAALDPEGDFSGGWPPLPYAAEQAYLARPLGRRSRQRAPAAARPLPPGLSLGAHDVNGDGRFNVRDYDGDPRVGDVNDNGIIDPQDLILLFSDGVDDDGNGYQDDISGWDFWERDNDAYDDTRFGHGNGGAHDSAAEGNNAIGGIGSCPDCSVIQLRVADSFIADGNDVALAFAYAADIGARVIGSSLGALSNPRAARDALVYATEQGIVTVASFADENSIHHNLPTLYDQTIATSAIGADNVNVGEVLPFTSFEAKNNCTNYGARLDLLIPAQYCSSEATATAAGHLGLLISYAEDLVARGRLDRSLSVNEAKQVVLQTANDVNPLPLPWRWPGGPRWDQVHGYGRIDMEAALACVANETIPPEVDIGAPGWFVTIDPGSDAPLEIVGRIAAERSSGYQYDLRWGWGVCPRRWHTITESPWLGAPTEGVLGTWRMHDLRRKRSRGVADRPNRFALTLWARAWDAGGILGEDRVQIFLHEDPDLHVAFPVELGASGESPPLFADLDGDGADEIVVATADGWVHALNAGGDELPGFPLRTRLQPESDPADPGNHLDAAAFASGAVPPIHGGVEGAVSCADLDADGTLELVAATLDGWVEVWGRDGAPRPGFPVRTDPELSRIRSPSRIIDDGIGGAPVLADLDGDGTREILVGAFDGHLYAWHHDGAAMSGFPLPVLDESEDEPTPSRIISTPAVGDLDGDGQVEIVVGSNEVYRNIGRLHALEIDGQALPGWPVEPLGFYADLLRWIGRGIPSSPVLADVTADGTLEVVVSSILGRTYVYETDGREIAETDVARIGPFSESLDIPTLSHLNSVAVGDMDGDGTLDVAGAGAGFRWALSQLFAGYYVPHDYHATLHDLSTGEFHPHFPRAIDGHTFLGNPALADLDGDDQPEMVLGSGAYLLHAFDHRGREPQGWPKGTGGWVIAAPAIGDLDGDGRFDVAAVTREGWLWAWRASGPAGAESAPWPTFHHDPARTGNLREATRVEGRRLLR